MRGLTFNNKTLFLSAIPKQYKSFMIVVNGNALPGVDSNIMEIGDIAINNMSGFNYVTANPTGSFMGINPPSYCVDGNTGTKWMTSQWWTDSTRSGMVIFTVNNPIVPSSYKLYTAGDAADQGGSKNPGPRALYGSTGTPTTSSDASWELLSYTDYTLPEQNYTWTSAMPTSNAHQNVNAVLGYEDTTHTVYEYFTFKAGPGSYSINADPVNWVPKDWTDSYLYDLDTSTQTSLKASNNDSFYMSYGNGHTYRAEWTEEAIISTRDSNTSYWNQFSIFYGGQMFNGIVELYSIDFWHKPKWNNTRFPDVTTIPQIAANIHRGDALTDCSNLFKNAPITNSLEAFILAMREACPNLTTTTGCFNGCTTAPDYAYCLANYPEWF